MQPTLTPKLAPYIVVQKDGPGLAHFLEKALGGQVTFQQTSPDGGLAHMEVQIADGLVMIGESPDGARAFPAMVHLYVPDPDAAYRTALEAGASSVRPVTDTPDGLRRGGVKDAWGNEWWFSRLPK